MMAKVLVIQDERITQLMREVRRHPSLMKKIDTAINTGANASEIIFTDTRGEDLPVINTFDQLVGFLAAEAGTLIHGIYTHEEICVLCDKIRSRLADKRVIAVN